MYDKSIHNRTMKNKYYLKNFMPDGYLDFWTEFFKTQIRVTVSGKISETENAAKGVKFGLCIHPINDGKINGRRKLLYQYNNGRPCRYGKRT